MRRMTTRGLADRQGSSFSRAVVMKTDADPKLQQGDFGMYAGEFNSGVEVAYAYGTWARVHGPMKMDGKMRHAESYILTATGSRSHPVALPPSDRRFPCPVKLKEGEVCHGDDQKQMTHYGRDGITITSPKKIVFKVGDNTSVTIEDGKITLKAAKIVSDGTVYLGGSDADKPASMKGTIDTGGNADKDNLATKVFLK